MAHGFRRRLPSVDLFAMLSASSTNDVRISALGNRSYALINCSAPSDAKKSRDLLAEAMSALVSRAKKNVGGTSRASAIRVSRPVEIRSLQRPPYQPIVIPGTRSGRLRTGD